MNSTKFLSAPGYPMFGGTAAPVAVMAELKRAYTQRQRFAGGNVHVPAPTMIADLPTELSAKTSVRRT